MDSFGGGLLYEKENLPQSFGANASKFSFEKFRYICILSGCDYLPSLPGIGLAKASKFFMLTTNSDLTSVLKKLPSYLKMPKLEVTEEYIDSFVKANNTFLYQLVFCPLKKCLVPLTPYPDGVNAADMEYAGKYLPDDIALELALGNINVKTLKKFDDSEADNFSDKVKKEVWGTISKKPENKKIETAFKFNSHKEKATKRKIECIEDDKNLPASETVNDNDELFAMYRNSNSTIDDPEEDPLAEIPEKKPKLSSLFSPEEPKIASEDISPKCSSALKRVVRSRFFASKEVKIESPSVLRENSPENMCNTDEISNAAIELSQEEKSIENSDVKIEPLTPTAVKSNKENIINRFAKKNLSSKPSNVSSDDITSSLTKVERSWLDIIDTESSSSTATVSSSGMAVKRLSLNGDEKVNTSDKSVVKIEKTKLISTKILDFKWDKDLSLKKNAMDNNKKHVIPARSESEHDEGGTLNVSQNDISTSETIDSLKHGECDIANNEVFVVDVDDPLMPSSSALSSSSGISSLESSPQTVIRPLELKQFSSKQSNKPGRCRSMGLSKKSKSSDKKISIQETLMNFSFVKKSKSEASFSS